MLCARRCACVCGCGCRGTCVLVGKGRTHGTAATPPRPPPAPPTHLPHKLRQRQCGCSWVAQRQHSQLPAHRRSALRERAAAVPVAHLSRGCMGASCVKPATHAAGVVLCRCRTHLGIQCVQLCLCGCERVAHRPQAPPQHLACLGGALPAAPLHSRRRRCQQVVRCAAGQGQRLPVGHVLAAAARPSGRLHATPSQSHQARVRATLCCTPCSPAPRPHAPCLRGRVQQVQHLVIHPH